MAANWQVAGEGGQALSSNRPVEFKPLSMMTLRSSPGEVIDSVARDGETYIIERNGRQLACLLPVSVFLPDIDQKRIEKDRNELAISYPGYTNGVSQDKELYFKVTQEEFSIKIVIPNGYPSNCPKVYVDGIEDSCPHRWKDGSLCIFGVMESWNPGKKSLLDVLELTHKWLASYKQWKSSGKWQSDDNGDELT